jgi:serine protease AprX
MAGRRRLIARAALLVAAGALVPATAGTQRRAPVPQVDELLPGVSRLAANAVEGVRTRAILTLDRPATSLLAGRLAALGLTVQPLSHLPMAIVAGTPAQLLAAVHSGLARDVYPDEPIELLSDESTATLRADIPRAAGFTGKGVTVAVIDSGIDATNPDLADHVAHNVILTGAEYANADPGVATIVVPLDRGPYNNTDLGSGHGTHVAGIVAADATSSPRLIGVAPDATLVGYAIGEVLFTTAVVTAFNHVLAHPEWGIDVVNNSWGNQFSFFDPSYPVNIATRAVTNRGIVVVFAAGNNGGPMSLNEFSVAPWVISVGNANSDLERNSSSSQGMSYDNAAGEVVLPPGGHASIAGDAIGIYHPDVMAQGTEVFSTASQTGTLVGPGRSATASGTSMASPHIAGAAAVLLQARPELTPRQVREVLQVTARPMAGEEHALWQVGYGHVDLAAAVELVRRPRFGADVLAALVVGADARMQRMRPWRVASGDYWAWRAALVTVGGVPDQRVVTIDVPAGTEGLSVAVAYPSLAAIGGNLFHEYSARVLDAAGKVVATTGAPDLQTGYSGAVVDLRELGFPPAWGTWTVELAGTLSSGDPDTIDSDSAQGRRIALAVHRLIT